MEIHMNSKLMTRKKYNKYFLILSYMLSVSVAVIVYYTGGTTNVYANLMYVPISIAASTCGKKCGIVHAVFSGLLVGPHMPLNSLLNISQEPVNWILRMLIYISISCIIGLFHDYGKKYEAYITDILTHDPITKLKNIQALKQVEKADGKKIIVSFSVKSYNEMVSVFGYDFSGKIVSEFTEMLKSALKQYENIELYKHEGMNFILIITYADKPEYCEYLTDEIMRISENLNSKSIIVDEIPVYIEISMGLSLVKEGESLMEGVRHSLIALEYSNYKNLKYSKYDKALDNHYNKILRIASSFRYALINDDIKIASQNIYSSKTGKVHGVELLARWILKDGTRIYTDEFIPVIEKTELMSELTKHMIDHAVDGLVKNKFKNVVSINFSVKDFNDDVVNYIISKVLNNNIEKGKLQIEITERYFLDKEAVADYMINLNDHGITIAVDDFGTGYSSYQYISELPISIVKIDKTLIEKIGESQISKNAVKSIVNFCKIYNFSTVAEGVETKEIADACADIGIDYLQGYYFHKPTIL